MHFREFYDVDNIRTDKIFKEHTLLEIFNLMIILQCLHNNFG